MKSMWVTAFSLKFHVGYFTLENFGTQCPQQLLRYPLAFNKFDNMAKSFQLVVVIGPTKIGILLDL